MKKISIFFATLFVTTTISLHGETGAHWGYTGNAGPDHWGELSEKFETCSSGMAQAPVNISGAKSEAGDEIVFHYNPSSFTVVNNGHSIQVNPEEESSITIGQRTYKLLQFHFHAPSENTVNGSPYAMEAHFVHKADNGEFAVVGVLFTEGSPSKELGKVWNFAPAKEGEKMGSGDIHPGELLPPGGSYYHFKGSLTTPPCSEGLQWYVLKDTITVSKKQRDQFLDWIGENARPVQPLHGREISLVNQGAIHIVEAEHEAETMDVDNREKRSFAHTTKEESEDEGFSWFYFVILPVGLILIITGGFVMLRKMSGTGSISFKNMKISARLIILLVVLMVPLVIVGFLGISGINSSNASIKSIYEERLIPTGELAGIQTNMLMAMIEMHLATKHDPRLEESTLHANHAVTKHTNAMREELKKTNEFWEEYINSDLSSEEQAKARDVDKELRTFEKEGLEVAIKLIEKHQFKELNTHVALVMPALFKNAEDNIELILEHQLEEAKAEDDKAVSNYTRIFAITMGSIFIGAVFSIGLGFLIIRGITGPLGIAVRRIKDIAEGEGDLTQRLAADTSDELGELAEWLNRFIEKVHDIVVDIAKTTEKVFVSARELAEASQSLSAGTEQMSEQSQNIASAAAQMNQNLQVISSSIEEMSISVSEVARQSAEASEVSSRANKTSLQTNDLVSKLGEDAREIGNAIESIVGIANQTNLLALNASIEAAGAGDAGKGFAVVASEVKELARQSAEFSADIREKIANVQNSTIKSVESIKEITQIIGQLNEISGTIASAVEEQSITSTEIANNVTQTTSASNEVAKNIEGISGAARDGAKSAGSVSRLSDELEKLSSNLNNIVSQFKINLKNE